MSNRKFKYYEKKAFTKELNEKVILMKYKKIWVSGGGRVILLMRGKGNGNYLWKAAPKETKEDWKRGVTAIAAFEKLHGIRLFEDIDGKTVYLGKLKEGVSDK